MIPRFLSEGPALLLKRSISVLVVADTHLGVESALDSAGWHLKSSSESRLQRILNCIEVTDPDLLLILGDLKHSVPRITWQEHTELPEFLDAIRRNVDLRLLPGNHDPGIERYMEAEEILNKNGVIIDGTGYLHGHTYPSPDLAGHLIVAGHHHPVIHLYDEVGCSLRGTPAYLLSEVNEKKLRMVETDTPTRLLLVPAFYEYAGGIDIRTIPESGISPLSRSIRIDTAEVFLQDGTYIDTLGSLRSEAHYRPSA
ncbi:MAG: Metallophosphoesterase [Methanomicrobiales archaeon 53_19]|uniref:metallophosphoesterase n=1 Tax=Methanocalculus sp. TaxID=2004547 RepID=UPI00074660CA|nr:metallophosphoesterase [Methanocalculus sp.]KUL03640.1 MAG: Metallophosphoesterase [Methanomicrobiales archaeon 53_19]HIJ07545.1 metallophosphoesterase [Methanocalculus sp.]